MNRKRYQNSLVAKAAVLLALFFTSASAATAQEYIKIVDNVKSDTSIIREYKENIRIIYSHSEDERYFLMVTETGVSTTLLVLKDDIYVTDFEIMGDTLYFCGIRYLNQLYSMLGYIDLANPSYPHHAYYFRDMDEFYKMEVFKSRFGGERHIAAVGGASIIDVRIAASGVWSFYYALADSTFAYFDDVAVTDTRVLASLRTETQNGYVYYYNHPAAGNSFLINPALKMHIGNHVLSAIILENCESDYYVSACRREDGEIGYYLDVKAYNGSIWYENIAIYASNSNEHPLDLKYNHDSRELDMLISGVGQVRFYSIYHFENTGNVEARYFYRHRIYSIDYLSTAPNLFIASGRDFDDDRLRFFKYNPFYFGKWKCSERLYPEYQKMKPLITYYPLEPRCSLFYDEGILTAQSMDSRSVLTFCENDPNLKEDEQ